MALNEKSTEKLVTNSTSNHENFGTISDERNTGGKILHSIKNSWWLLKPILCGQLLSVLICATSICSEYLTKQHVDTPVFQNLPNYLCFTLVYTTTLFIKRDENDGQRLLVKILKESWWKYLIIAVIDVEANYLIVKAYQYTSITSVQLLDCFVILVVMMLSCYFLKVRYVAVHYVGLVISLVGVVCMVVADLTLGSENGVKATNPALGDVLVLLAATCYGMSNVAMEYVSKKKKNGNIHILGMLGLFCPLIAGTQCAILEHEQLASIAWSWEVVGLLAGYTCAMFILYTCMPLVMKLSSATAVNISILTADLFALLVGHYLFQYQFSPLYLVSLGTIVVALVIYNSRMPIQLNEEEGDDEERQISSTPGRRLDSELQNEVISSI